MKFKVPGVYKTANKSYVFLYQYDAKIQIYFGYVINTVLGLIQFYSNGNCVGNADFNLVELVQQDAYTTEFTQLKELK